MAAGAALSRRATLRQRKTPAFAGVFLYVALAAY